MKHDDRTVTGIAAHVGKHLLGRELLGVVASHQVVHHDVVAVLDGTRLLPAQQSVGRPEKIAPYQVVGLGNVVHIAVGRNLHALQMVHRVVAHTVAAATHLLEQLRIAGHIVAYHEKGRLDAIAVEGVEHPRRHLGDGAVVESEEHDLLVVALEAPYGLGKKEAVE